MGNKIKPLLEGFKYQEIATIYYILKYIYEKDMEIYIEKQNEEDVQFILNNEHIIDLQFKNKVDGDVELDEFCNWLSHFEERKSDVHLLKKLVQNNKREVIFVTSGRCTDDTKIFIPKKNKKTKILDKELKIIREKLENSNDKTILK